MACLIDRYPLHRQMLPFMISGRSSSWSGCRVDAVTIMPAVQKCGIPGPAGPSRKVDERGGSHLRFGEQPGPAAEDSLAGGQGEVVARAREAVAPDGVQVQGVLVAQVRAGIAAARFARRACWILLDTRAVLRQMAVQVSMGCTPGPGGRISSHPATAFPGSEAMRMWPGSR
jgi:hypothetical protein